MPSLKTTAKARLVLALLLFDFQQVLAPRAAPTFRIYGVGSTSHDPAASTCTSASTGAAAVATAAVAAVAAAAALKAITTVRHGDAPPHISNSAPVWKGAGYFPKSGSRPSVPLSLDGEAAECAEVLVDSEDELGADVWECDDCLGDENACEDGEQAVHETSTSPMRSRCPSKKGAGKLWTTVQFPEGVKDACDMRNLMAAQAWSCPCKDRINCIGTDRIDITLLYEYRKLFQTTCGTDGGKRDATRMELASHYSSATRDFGRSFVVGARNDCCAASAGLAKGLAFGTWARARVDVRKSQPMRDGRKVARERQLSEERTYIENYIRELREGMEGSKGREETDTWHTSRMSVKRRYGDYRSSLIRAKLPVVGSLSLFEKVWKEHTEIRQLGAKNHAKCDLCGKLEVELANASRRSDSHGRDLRDDIHRRKAIHSAEHRKERNYADDIYKKAEKRPMDITALNIDAPTQDQFDIPVQDRRARDVIKSLESNLKWKSKITGVMAAGVGMVCYVTRCGLGSGPNLTCTTLYLALLLVSEQRGLGSRLNVLFDNTSGDNKNKDVVAFMSWLVLMDIFQDASFFCMQKGHTFTILDQSFNTMISQLMRECINTMSSLLSFMFQFLRPYDVHDVMELHSLWDWKSFLEPHYNRLEGFGTSQFGSGMHEVYCRKDAYGDVRVWMRQSSQATHWLPEGPGYKIFNSVPNGSPNLAKARPDTSWSRTAVEGTIRSWYRFMVVDSPAELAKVKIEWESMFDCLPTPDGDINSLPNNLKQRWFELPKFAQSRSAHVIRTGAASNSATAGISASLENPIVNPITGPGRTSADVQRELQAHRERRRREGSASGGPYPIFQADFVFLQLPGRELELHRVAHGMVIPDAEDPDLCFSTTEYEHTPQSGVEGFFGTFEKKLNPAYDAKDPHKGLMHIRHHAVGRDSIKLYDVETFTEKVAAEGIERAKTVVRVSAAALRQLAAVCPSQPMPSRVPPTHLPHASNAGGRGRGERGVGSRGGGRGQGLRGAGGARGGARAGGVRAGRTREGACGGADGQGHGAGGRGDSGVEAAGSESAAETAGGRGTQREREQGAGTSAGAAAEDVERPRRRQRRVQHLASDSSDSSSDRNSSSSDQPAAPADASAAAPAAAPAAASAAASDAAPAAAPAAAFSGAPAAAEHGCSETSDDDVPPPVPDGFELCNWNSGQPLPPGQIFLIWTCLGGRRLPSWQQASVAKQLEADRADGFTHDAVFASDRRQYPRGVSLTADLHTEGCWVLLQKC